MYVVGRADHYLAVGLSAVRCIRQAFGDGRTLAQVGTVLDFASGFGRVLRWFPVMCRSAEIWCTDVDSDALKFCSRRFGVRTVTSSLDVDAITIPATFDLIWCGSLLTHLHEDRTAAFLRLFCERLSENGVCIFTMHGCRSSEWIKTGLHTYGLSTAAQDALVAEFEEKGYGYVPSDGRQEYGISLAAESWTDAAARRAGPWHRILFKAQGWDNHQDVYAFVRSGSRAS
jgi:methyltransferase family protein